MVIELVTPLTKALVYLMLTVLVSIALVRKEVTVMIIQTIVSYQ